jgi:competence protein ComEC
MKAPLLLLACCFAAGIVAANRVPVSLTTCLVLCGACLAAGLVSWQKRWHAAAGLLTLAGFAFAGVSTIRLSAYRFPANHISRLSEREIGGAQPVRLEGSLDASPLVRPYGLQLDVDAHRIWSLGKTYSAAGKIRLYVMNGRKSGLPAASLKLHYGDSITAWVQLERPQNYANPGGFDYRRWLASIQDIYWQGRIEDPGSIRNLSASPAGKRASSALPLIERVRQRLLASIDKLYPPWTREGKNGAVLKAVLLGDRSSLDSDTIEDFRRTGLYHLLVVAGLHVGLLAMLAEGLLRLLRIPSDWRAALLLILLGFYASLVDQRAPTLRASLMIGAYLVARLLDREEPVLNAIGFAALILLLDRPGWLDDAGFQLSFAAALLIGGLALPILERTTEPYRRALWHVEEPALDKEYAPHLAQLRLDVRDACGWLGRQSGYLSGQPGLAEKIISGPLKACIWILDLLIFSVVLQFGLLLPMAEIFHRVTLAGIGLNVFAIPCMTILLAIALPTIILNVFSLTLAVLPGRILAAVLNGLFYLTELRNIPHWLSYRVATPPPWVAWGFALSLILAGCALPFGRHLSLSGGTAALLFSGMICLQPFAPRIPAGAFEITALDCGGGEALFIVLPDRSTMLIGACGRSRRRAAGGDPVLARRWDPGENIIAPYLWSRRVETIDVLLVPDDSGDHLSGVASLIRSFRVKEFWCGMLPPPSLLGLLHQRGVLFRVLSPGEIVSRDGDSVDVLWPSKQDSSQPRTRGNAPFLIRISEPQGSLLLDGGLTASDRGEFLDSTLAVPSDVLQLSDSRELQAAMEALAVKVHPRIVLVGSEASFKSQKVALRGFLERGIRVFNLATDGAVTVEMRGDLPAVHCYLTPCR